ncbi:uncharacterized, partial [Tachysurus ichikawai]
MKRSLYTEPQPPLQLSAPAPVSKRGLSSVLKQTRLYRLKRQ